MRQVDFPPPKWDPSLERAVYGHTWQPISATQISRYTGFRYNAVRDVLISMRVRGLLRRRPQQGGRGWEWYRG